MTVLVLIPCNDLDGVQPPEKVFLRTSTADKYMEEHHPSYAKISDMEWTLGGSVRAESSYKLEPIEVQR